MTTFKVLVTLGVIAVFFALIILVAIFMPWSVLVIGLIVLFIVVYIGVDSFFDGGI